MKVEETPIAGLYLVETDRIQDHRGSFYRAFCDDELRAPLLGNRTIRQINVSFTEQVGALRGMHFQMAPFEEMKLIRCLQGRVWDVVVDLRPSSKTFRQWHAEVLSEQNTRMLVIPEGCAHGFQVMERNSELLYLHTAPYVQKSERGVRYDDPALRILWPLQVTDISHRDICYPLLERR